MHELETEKYSPLFGELTAWRTNHKDTYKGILPFVSGLRFSVKLLYLVKDAFKNSSIDATWGHIVDKTGKDAIVFSNECDIIVYKKIAGSVIREWNGHTSQEYKAMDFKFINVDSVVGVISCKGGKLIKSKIDGKYPKQLRTFTENVWLYAEYCNVDSYKEIRREAKKMKYKDLWCLYEWDKKDAPKPNVESWSDFDKILSILAKKHK